jgi:hypothetical protein
MQPDVMLTADILLLSFCGLLILLTMVGVAYLHPLSEWNQDQ